MGRPKQSPHCCVMFDMAILWSCRVYQDFEKGTGTTVEKWEGFKAELKKQFYPNNATFQDRDALMKLKHTGLIVELIKKFLDMALQLPDMGDVDRLYHFAANLTSR